MADDNKNLAGDTERTSILPQSGAQAAGVGRALFF